MYRFSSRAIALAIVVGACALCVTTARLVAQSPRDHEPLTRVDAAEFIAPVVSSRSSSLGERAFTYDAVSLRALDVGARSLILAHFPIDDHVTGDLELARQRPVVDARTMVRVGTADGEIAGRLPAVCVYRGSIRGEKASRAFLVSAGDELYGFVDRADGRRYVIGPGTDDDAGGRLHVITPESSFPEASRDAATSCLADGTVRRQGGSVRRDQAGLLSNDLLEFRIAVEADQEFFRRTGGTVEKATGYVIALWSMVSAMYEDEIGVTFRLPWIKIWTTPDPYQVAGNGYALWGKAPAYWREHYAGVERDLAHIFTASDWGGGGIAFRGEGIDGNQPVLCSRETGYAMSSPRGVLSYPTFAFTYDAYIVAHETGHNFGARHTHDCWWNPALDTCMTRDDQQFRMDDACLASPAVPTPSAGSIMSYCMGVNQKAGGGSFEAWSVRLAFTPRVAAVMRREAELASCRRSPATPTIVLTNPRGMIRRLPADTTITVTWKAAGVASYDVEYSADDARTWIAIASSLPADVLSRAWAVPRLCSDSVWVRIVDADDAAIGDTSMLRVAIAGPIGPPEITANGSPRICSGDSLLLSAPEGFATYRWSTGARTRSIFASVAGDYSVFVTSGGGCAGESAPFTVTALPAPAKPTITRRGDTLKASGGVAWQWSRDGEPLAGATSAELVATIPGLYGVAVIDTDGCRSLSDPFAVSSSAVSGDAAGAPRLTMAIGANGRPECCAVRYALGTPSHAVLTIVDNAGRRIATLIDAWSDGGSHEARWDRTARPAGTYWAVLRASGTIVIERIVVP
jgi:hypothetical protein